MHRHAVNALADDRLAHVERRDEVKALAPKARVVEQRPADVAHPDEADVGDLVAPEQPAQFRGQLMIQKI